MNYKCPCCQALDNHVSGRTSQWYTLIAELMMFELKSVCRDFISFSAEKVRGGKCTVSTGVHWGTLGYQHPAKTPCSTAFSLRNCGFLLDLDVFWVPFTRAGWFCVLKSTGECLCGQKMSVCVPVCVPGVLLQVSVMSCHDWRSNMWAVFTPCWVLRQSCWGFWCWFQTHSFPSTAVWMT